MQKIFDNEKKNIMKRIFDHEKIFGHEKYLDQENMTQCVSAVKRIPYPSLLVDYIL